MRKTSLILLLVLLFNLVGCSAPNSNLPKGFKNEQLYRDLIYVLQTIESDYKNNTLTHSYEEKSYYEDDFLVRFEKTASENKLTKIEKDAFGSAHSVLSDYYLFYHKRNSPSFPREDKGYKEKIINNLQNISNILELNINIKDRL